MRKINFVVGPYLVPIEHYCNYANSDGASGTLTDWATQQGVRLAYTVELRCVCVQELCCSCSTTKPIQLFVLQTKNDFGQSDWIRD